MIECPTCGFDNEDEASWCDRCERPLSDIKAARGDDDGGARPITQELPVAAAARPADVGLAKAGEAESDNALDLVDRVQLSDPSALAGLNLSVGGPPEVASPPGEERPPASGRFRQTFHEGLPAISASGLVRVGETGADGEEYDEWAAYDQRTQRRQGKRPAAKTQALPAVGQPPPFAPPVRPPPFQPPYPAGSPSSSASPSSRTVVVHSGPQAAAGFFAGVSVALMAVGVVLAVWHTWDEATVEAPAPPPPGRVPVDEGPFLKGLSNDLRLMFARTCKRVAEEPEVACKEEVALREEYPQTTVEVASFRIDRYEVTNADWAGCVEAGACAPVAWEACENRTTQGYVPFLRVPQALRAADRPVVCVTRGEAAAFCEHAGGRLPREDEWEKAARGVDAFLFPWGSDWDPELANWGEQDATRTAITGKLDGHLDTAPVGAFPAGRSQVGAFDMAGNVAEWVVREGDTAMEATARGGSWLSNPTELRATHRLFVKPDARRTDVGFRCVADP